MISTLWTIRFKELDVYFTCEHGLYADKFIAELIAKLINDADPAAKAEAVEVRDAS